MRERVLLDISEPRVRERIGSALRDQGQDVAEVGAGREDAAAALVLDFPGAGGIGLERLRRARERRPRPAVVALCRHGSVESGVAALKEGSDEFLLAPFDLDELSLKLERALELRRLREQLGAPASPRITRARHVERAELAGESAAIERVREQVARVSGGRATVLLTGETGTGKELVATAIHQASPRVDHAMIKVNCAALPDPLLESELFGHERGAFTGAEKRRIGRFEEAHGGTLFLDEIGDMHPRTQAKVLRALQEQEFERLGGTRPIRVDVRIIAATNQDLRQLIERGQFREDLFFRLNVVPIELPSLRERVEDIPVLARRFLCELGRVHLGPARSISPGALAALSRYPWPGNVRELRNSLERALLMGEGERIEAGDLALHAGGASSAPSRPAGGGPAVLLPPGGVDLREVERELILQALERTGWVQKEAASLLRMSRRKLNYRIRLLRITHPSWRRNRGSASRRGDVS